jgi:hypothetical protein
MLSFLISGDITINHWWWCNYQLAVYNKAKYNQCLHHFSPWLLQCTRIPTKTSNQIQRVFNSAPAPRVVCLVSKFDHLTWCSDSATLASGAFTFLLISLVSSYMALRHLNLLSFPLRRAKWPLNLSLRPWNWNTEGCATQWLPSSTTVGYQRSSTWRHQNGAVWHPGRLQATSLPGVGPVVPDAPMFIHIN